jgi:hypothetical protein
MINRTKNKCFIYQQSIKSHSHLYVPGLRHYGTPLFCTRVILICVFCMISTIIAPLDYFHVIVFLLLFKIDHGYVLCAVRIDFVYGLDKRQMLTGWETLLGGPVGNKNPCTYLQMYFKLSAPSIWEEKQNS